MRDALWIYFLPVKERRRKKKGGSRGSKDAAWSRATLRFCRGTKKVVHHTRYADAVEELWVVCAAGPVIDDR